MKKKIKNFIVGLFLIVALTQSGYAADSTSNYDDDSSSNAMKVSAIYSKTLTNLMRAAQEMGHSIEKRINKIQIIISYQQPNLR